MLLTSSWLTYTQHSPSFRHVTNSADGVGGRRKKFPKALTQDSGNDRFLISRKAREMIASRGTNMTLTIARIRPNRDAIRDAANEAQHYEIEDCPTHGAVRIRALVDFPSMMGYGTDSVTTFTCGCTHSDTPMGR